MRPTLRLINVTALLRNRFFPSFSAQLYIFVLSRDSHFPGIILSDLQRVCFLSYIISVYIRAGFLDFSDPSHAIKDKRVSITLLKMCANSLSFAFSRER